MTRKRFTLTYEKIGKHFTMGIVDHETKEPFDNTTYEFNQCSFNDSKDEMEDLCLLLNELHEKTKELRLQLNLCSDQRNEFHRGARENANRVGKLEKENEQLKLELNTYKEANKLLKQTIDRLRTDNTKQKKLLNETMKRNRHTTTTIQTMMETERTELGKSVLTQLWEQIQ